MIFGDISVNDKLALIVFLAGVFVGMLPGFGLAWFLICCAEKRTKRLMALSLLYVNKPAVDYDGFEIPEIPDAQMSMRQPDGCGF